MQRRLPCFTEILVSDRKHGTQGVARRVDAVLLAHGGEEAEDALPSDQPLSAEIYAAAATGRVARGPRRGTRPRRLGDRIAIERIGEADVPGVLPTGHQTAGSASSTPPRYDAYPSVIGEAASRLSETLRLAHSSTAWAKIVASRNVVVHGYFGLNC